MPYAIGFRFGCNAQAGRLVGLTHDAVDRLFDEGGDVVDMLTWRHLIFNLQDGIFDREVAEVDQSIGVANVTERALVSTRLLENSRVHTAIGCGVASQNDVWRHVLLHATTALHQGVAAYLHTNLTDDTVGENGVAVYLYAAREYGVDAQDTAVLDVYIVADVGVIHQAIVVANGCAILALVTASDDTVLADGVVVTNRDVYRCAFLEMETLRHSTDDGILENLIVLAYARAVEDGGLWVDDGVVTNLYVGLYVGKGIYLYVLAYLCARFDDGLWRYHRNRIGMWNMGFALVVWAIVMALGLLLVSK